MHVQVFFLSDICSADGSRILPSYKYGHKISTRHSSLDWPFQPRPPAPAWRLWKNALQHLESHDQLTTSLGNWIATTHQTWEHFLYPATNTFYTKSNDGWVPHSPRPSQRYYHTRQSGQLRYTLVHNTTIPTLPPGAVPATVISDTLGLPGQCLVHSQTPLCEPCVTPNTNHVLPSEDGFTPHPYYAQLLNWDSTELLPAIPSIALALREQVLHICADGSYFKDNKQGNQAWVFANDRRQILWKGAGPSVGYSTVMSPYRAELSGLTSVLFVLLWICNTEGIEIGHMPIFTVIT
jgi:hypothetical protein